MKETDHADMRLELSKSENVFRIKVNLIYEVISESATDEVRSERETDMKL